MSVKRSEELLRKYLNEGCTPEEEAIVESWYNEISGKQKDELPEPDYMSMKQEVFNAIHIAERRNTASVQKLWPRIAVATAVLLIIGAGLFVFKNKDHKLTGQSAQMANDITPGGNKAFLTLANGNRISLTDAKNGEVAEQAGIKITKAADGQLVYSVSNSANENDKAKGYHTIETPNGGEYQIVLPDGTKVWLNAATLLKYPSTFARLVNRKVELLRGEAYFEVSKDKRHPFVVKSAKQEVEVLGTHFNINAYADEGKTTTSLLEGSVKIIYAGDSRLLKPGEQAISTGNGIPKIKGGAEDAIAWRRGLFKFENADVKTVLRQLARWYDVDIVYEGNVKPYNFTGEIYRNLNLSEALIGLRFTGLKFRVENKRITVANET